MVAQAVGPEVAFVRSATTRTAWRNRDTELVVAGPAGTGKTFAALWRLHLIALKYPGARLIMLRKVQEDLTASALATYQERILGAGKWAVKPFGGSNLKPAGFTYLNTGARLMIGGLDKADKVMSREYDVIYVNECWELTEEEWEKLSTRINRPGRAMPWNQLFGDTNPQGPGHWILKREQRGLLTLLPSTHKDNPAMWDGARWTDEGLAYLASLGTLSGHVRRRLLDGVWAAAEGVVYPGFDRQTHVKRIADADQWAAILALDVGVDNPTALLTIRHGSDRFHVEREWYVRGMGASDIVAAVAAEMRRSGAAYLVMDPSAALIRGDLLSARVPIRLGVNDIKIGIGRVRDVLPNLTVDPSCERTIEEFETYAYPKGNTTSDVPKKEHDHAMDALRYGVMDLAGPRLPEPRIY